MSMSGLQATADFAEVLVNENPTLARAATAIAGPIASAAGGPAAGIPVAAVSAAAPNYVAKCVVGMGLLVLGHVLLPIAIGYAIVDGVRKQLTK